MTNIHIENTDMPQPFPSWQWVDNGLGGFWDAPVPCPTDGGAYTWNEEQLTWEKESESDMDNNVVENEVVEQTPPEAPHQVVVDCETGKTEYVLLSEEEIANLAIAQQEAQQHQIEMQAKMDAERALRDVAMEKVTAKLGLTKEELDTLVSNGDFSKIITQVATLPETELDTTPVEVPDDSEFTMEELVPATEEVTEVTEPVTE